MAGEGPDGCRRGLAAPPRRRGRGRGDLPAVPAGVTAGGPARRAAGGRRLRDADRRAEPGRGGAAAAHRGAGAPEPAVRGSGRRAVDAPGGGGSGGGRGPRRSGGRVRGTRRVGDEAARDLRLAPRRHGPADRCGRGLGGGGGRGPAHGARGAGPHAFRVRGRGAVLRRIGRALRRRDHRRPGTRRRGPAGRRGTGGVRRARRDPSRDQHPRDPRLPAGSRGPPAGRPRVPGAAVRGRRDLRLHLDLAEVAEPGTRGRRPAAGVRARRRGLDPPDGRGAGRRGP